MKKVFHLIISPFILMLFLTSLSTAGNGKIAGVVKDSTAKPLKGASVILSCQKQIYLSDADGRYFILNLSPGKYDVVISATGFNKRTVKSVEVRSDLTTELNIVLESTTVKAEGIVVDAERNLINKTITSSKTIYSADEIASTFGTSSTFEILQTAPGVYKGFLRGGLQNMTKTIVDGVDISDSYYEIMAEQSIGSMAYSYRNIVRNRESRQAVMMMVNLNSISELTVNTGAVSADYFSAASGIINYSLKEGKGDLAGKVNLKTANHKLGIAGPDIYNDKNKYFSERDNLFARKTNADSIRAKRYTWSESKYQNGQTPFEAEISLDGSINEKLGFFFSTNFKNNPDCRLPNQRYKESNSQLKLNYDVNSNIKITALGMLYDKGKLFGWKNSNYQESWRYYLEAVPQNDGTNWVGSIKLSHQLSPSTFYEAQISNKNSINRIGFVDGNNDGKLQLNEDGNFIDFTNLTNIRKYASNTDYLSPFQNGSQEGPVQTGWYGPGGTAIYLCRPNIFYEKFISNTFTSKLDFTTQLSFNHQLKSGVSYVTHDLDMTREAVDYGSSNVVESWNLTPAEFGSYIQDKFEYEGLVLNLGLRFDLWSPNGTALKNIKKPYSIQKEQSSEGIISFLGYERGENIDPYTFFSPKIAISQPVADNASLYFSYSKMFQPPALSMLYTNYYNVFNLSNAEILSVDREPYKATNYEIGIQWNFVDNFTLNINAYQTDIQNYLNSFFSLRTTLLSPSIYYLYFSTGMAHSRGIEVTLEGLQTKISDFIKFSERLSYTYSNIEAPNILFGLTEGDKNSFTFTDTLKSGFQLPFDDVKYYSRVETEITGGSSNLNAGYNREHRIAFTLLAELPYDIFITGIGLFQSGFKYVRQYVDPYHTGRELGQSPWNKQIDVRIEKAIKLSRFRFALFIDIKNLFDAKNIIAYDNTYTGYGLFQTNNDPTGTQKRPIGQDGSLFYDIPREVYFGVSLEF